MSVELVSSLKLRTGQDKCLMRHRHTHLFLQDEIAILYHAAMQIEDEVQHMQIAKDSFLITFFFHPFVNSHP